VLYTHARETLSKWAGKARQQIDNGAHMKVFLSYSAKDKDFARRLAGDLDRAGIEVWRDEGELRVGESLAAIELAIRSSDCLVVIVSRAASESAWVRRELGLADRLGVRVLPALLEEVRSWAPASAPDLAHADFRRKQDFRRSTQRLIAAIEGINDGRRFLPAKEAVAIARAERNPTGDLFGASQQGVGILYSLTNFRDWEFADVTDGSSRLWITEFYDAREKHIQPYAVMDGRVYDLPESYLLGADPEPLPDSAITYSCNLNMLPGMVSPDKWDAIRNEHPDLVGNISRRYICFRPIPLIQEYVDSPVAVSAAIRSAFEDADTKGYGEDLFILTKLECDKRYWEMPTWIVSFFDPTLAESVLTVGVDAITGIVRHPRMRSEILNAAFTSVHSDEVTGGVTLNLRNQMRAMQNHIWDIPRDGAPAPDGLTAAEALEMAQDLLQSTAEPHRWQIAFLSSLGVVNHVQSPDIPRQEIGLMKRGGRAGQWVIELFGSDQDAPWNNDHQGYLYPFRQILCTRARGAVDIGANRTLVFDTSLSRSPLPHNLLDAYEKARILAIKTAVTDFVVMSVTTIRMSPEATWKFLFHGADGISFIVTVSGDGNRVLSTETPDIHDSHSN